MVEAVLKKGEATIYEKHQKLEHVAVLTLNRPEAMNAKNRTLVRELSESLEDFRDDPDSWILILTGAGERAFCAGADLKEMAQGASGTQERPRFQGRIETGTLEIWKPIIVAINGYALGGGLEIVMACDIRIAAEHAKIGLMELRRGINPGSGGMYHLPRQVPLPVAMEMLLTGEPVSAQEAYRLGLVNQVVPMAELMPAAYKMAERILDCAPIAVRAAKESVYRGLEMHLRDALVSKWGPDLGRTEDSKEGPRAFAEKRKPVWKGA